MPSQSFPRRFSHPLIAAALLASASGAALAQGGADTSAAKDSLTPASIGVYTAEQAARGKDIYLTNCVSCHTPADHTGGGFWSDLVGKRVSKFYKYLRENMPQDNAGAISDDDYASVVAYIFQLNGLPPGATPLATDTLKLAKIRITQPDSTRKGP